MTKTSGIFRLNYVYQNSDSNAGVQEENIKLYVTTLIL